MKRTSIVIGLTLLLRGMFEPITLEGPYVMDARDRMFFIMDAADLNRPVLAVKQSDVIYCVDTRRVDRGCLDRALTGNEYVGK